MQELDLKRENIGRLETKKLPKPMQTMNDNQRKEYIEKMRLKRKKLQTKIDELVKKRATYKAKEIKSLSSKEKNSFDQNMVNIIHKQAKTKNINY
ncbi:MAG: hypothetical protein HRU28_07560 [Rhizobiales bacterium]|nr:hypothetical protein [Hyphomicrobiales bacterium]